MRAPRTLGKAVRLTSARHAEVAAVAGDRPVQDVVDDLLAEALAARAHPAARARPKAGARAPSRGGTPVEPRQVSPRWKAAKRG